LLERFSQNAFQSAQKRESWGRIAQLVDKTAPERTPALADAIVSALGAERADKLGEFPSFRLLTNFCLPLVCLFALLSHHPYRDFVTRIRPARLTKNARFVYIAELILTYVFPHAPSLFP
jgi:hypothetical protein